MSESNHSCYLKEMYTTKLLYRKKLLTVKKHLTKEAKIKLNQCKKKINIRRKKFIKAEINELVK